MIRWCSGYLCSLSVNKSFTEPFTKRLTPNTLRPMEIGLMSKKTAAIDKRKRPDVPRPYAPADVENVVKKIRKLAAELSVAAKAMKRTGIESLDVRDKMVVDYAYDHIEAFTARLYRGIKKYKKDHGIRDE